MGENRSENATILFSLCPTNQDRSNEESAREESQRDVPFMQLKGDSKEEKSPLQASSEGMISSRSFEPWSVAQALWSVLGRRYDSSVVQNAQKLQ